MSLKQYLNYNNQLNKNHTNFSKFQINIVQNTQDSDKIGEGYDTANRTADNAMSTPNQQIEINHDPNMIKIKFVVNKDEWKKKKRMIIYNYDYHYYLINKFNMLYYMLNFTFKNFY